MTERTKKIRILWVRHGYSCANNKKKKSFTPFAHVFVKDPSLHCVGAVQAKELGKDLKGQHIDLFCSSQLRRAIETAVIIQKNYTTHQHDIHILPHINESGLFRTPDNTPSIYMKSSKEFFDPSQYTNYELFKELVFPKLAEKVSGKHPTILIVSHSSFLKDVFGIKLDNGQIIVQEVKQTRDGFEFGKGKPCDFCDHFTTYTKEIKVKKCSRCKSHAKEYNFDDDFEFEHTRSKPKPISKYFSNLKDFLLK